MEFVHSWVEPYFGAEMEDLGESSCQLTFHGVGSSLMVQNPGLRSPTLGVYV